MILYVYRWKNEYLPLLEHVKEIAVPYLQILQNPRFFCEIRNKGVGVYGVLPAVSAGFHDQLLRELALKEGRLDEMSFFKPIEKSPDFRPRELSDVMDGIYIGNQGQWEAAMKLGLPVFGDQSLNVFNSKTAEFWREKGLERVTFSYELETEQLRELSFKGEGEILLYGRVPVMVSEYCPVAGERGGSQKDCGACRDGGPWYLRSKKGDVYPVLLDRNVCRSTLLSSLVLDRRKERAKAGKKGNQSLGNIRWRLCVSDESPGQIERILTSL